VSSVVCVGDASVSSVVYVGDVSVSSVVYVGDASVSIVVYVGDASVSSVVYVGANIGTIKERVQILTATIKEDRLKADTERTICIYIYMLSRHQVQGT
jgi:hypothetical protein